MACFASAFSRLCFFGVRSSPGSNIHDQLGELVWVTGAFWGLSHADNMALDAKAFQPVSMGLHFKLTHCWTGPAG